MSLLSQSELQGYLSVVDKVPEAERKKIQKLLELDRVQRCREDFLFFVQQMWPVFISGQHHKIMADAFQRVADGKLKRLIINMPPRHRLKLDTPIPTVDGWKTVETVQVGDYVFAPDGSPVMVTGKSDVYEEDLYEVTSIDGHKVICDGQHLWTVRFGVGKFQTYETRMLWERENGASIYTSKSGRQMIRGRKVGKENRPAMLPVNEAVQYPRKGLLIDPYVLGVWLGDGSKNNGVITSHDDDAQFIRPEIERRGYVTTDQATKYTFGVLKLKAQLQAVGVLGNKHIPQDYLQSSVEQRMDLLRGLMDTDGNVTKAGQCFFNQKDPAFIEQVVELLNSLGIKNSVCQSAAKIGDKSYGMGYRISFYKKDCCFLPRKNARTKDLAEYNKPRSIRFKKLNQRGLVRCLEVANADGLFLIGKGFLVGHNTKSEFASYLLPAWFLGRFPHKKVIQTAHTAELSVGFGRKVRNLVQSEPYGKIFQMKLSTDSKAAGRWNTDKGGDYFAIGVGGAVTGKGADLLIIDDPHSEQEAKQNKPEVYDAVYEWYTSGPRQRLQPGGAIIIVMTRWSTRDLTGQILQKSGKDGTDDWEVIEFPAILPSGNPLWPQFWKKTELEALKSELPVAKWEAQYQQNPTSEEGAIVKREYWKLWVDDEPPACDYLIQSWDTAFEKNNRADFSACTTWGVFYKEDDNGDMRPNVILLDAFKDRMEFPELKKKAMEMWKEWNPDTLIVEKRAAGSPLIYELRRMGIPLSEYTPGKGHDKIARLNSVADLFASGVVWRPDRRWAEEVVEEMAAFPNGAHDDLVDSSTQALMRFRQGGFITIASDEPDSPVTRRRMEYY